MVLHEDSNLLIWYDLTRNHQKLHCLRIQDTSIVKSFVLSVLYLLGVFQAIQQRLAIFPMLSVWFQARWDPPPFYSSPAMQRKWFAHLLDISISQAWTNSFVNRKSCESVTFCGRMQFSWINDATLETNLWNIIVSTYLILVKQSAVHNTIRSKKPIQTQQT